MRIEQREMLPLFLFYTVMLQVQGISYICCRNVKRPEPYYLLYLSLQFLLHVFRHGYAPLVQMRDPQVIPVHPDLFSLNFPDLDF